MPNRQHTRGRSPDGTPACDFTREALLTADVVEMKRAKHSRYAAEHCANAETLLPSLLQMMPCMGNGFTVTVTDWRRHLAQCELGH